MKKILAILSALVLLTLSLCGCAVLTTKSEKASIPSDSSSPSNEIAAETLKITEQEAIEIASQHWGIKSGDTDEATGFPFLVMPVVSSNDNIKIALKWLVANQNYSTVDMVEIDPYTGKIINVDTEE